jgi:electron transfer flavoprotein alpha/beta subunit
LNDEPNLPTADRAAAWRGIQFAGSECHVQTPPDDQMAIAYATAIGARCELDAAANADFVLIGSGAIDHWGDARAGQLAEELSAELLFDVLDVERTGNHWRVVSDAGRGARQIVTVAGPLVLVLSEHVAKPPYVSRYRLAQAEVRNVVTNSVVASKSDWQPVTPRVPRRNTPSTTDVSSRTNDAFGIASEQKSLSGSDIISAEPKVCAEILLRYLVHHGFLVRDLKPEPVVSATSKPVEVQTKIRSKKSELLPPSILRQPRRSGESTSCLARRPRKHIAATSLPITPSLLRLQRGPRRLGASNMIHRRGPFPLNHPR